MTLLERVLAATGPDREIDMDIWWFADGNSADTAFHNGALGLPKPLDHTKPMPMGLGRAAVRAASPKFTSDLNAVIALVERAQPGYDWMLRRIHSSSATGLVVEAAIAPSVTRHDGLPKSRKKLGLWIQGRGPTPALALLAALLRSLEGGDNG